LTDDRAIEIRDNPEEGAYVIEVDGRRAGKAEYKMREGRRVFTHTEVDDEFAGTGLANRLARFALDDVRASGGQLVPLCPFIAAYIKRHPQYDEIVDHQMTMNLKKRQDRS